MKDRSEGVEMPVSRGARSPKGAPAYSQYVKLPQGEYAPGNGQIRDRSRYFTNNPG